MKIWLGLYRALVALLPPDIRRRYGADMMADLEARLSGTRGLARARVGAGALLDGIRHGSGMWRDGRASGPGTRITGLAGEIGQSIRSLGRSPGMTVSAGITLALGIGMSAAVFSVVNAVLLEPLPYPEPDRLVSVWPEQNFNVALTRRMADVEGFEAVTGLSHWSLTLTGDGLPARQIQAVLVSVDHFRVLGVVPALGRDFRPGEDRTGDDGVAMISHGLWVSRFGADPEVVGRVVGISGAGHDHRRVIGVLPPGYVPLGSEVRDVWVPLATEAGVGLADDGSWYVNRRVARLAPGVTPEVAHEQLRAVAADIQAEIPERLEDVPVGLVPLRDEEVGAGAPVLWALLGAVGLVLLIACLNVANLMAARAEARSRERAVRRALGANRWALVRNALVDAGVLAALGLGPAVALAVGIVRYVQAHADGALPRGMEIGVDGSVLLGATAATFLATVITAVAPALRTEAPAEALSGARTAGPSRSPVRAVLIGSELALSLVLVTGAGLLVRSMGNLLAVDPGFEVENLLTVRPAPPEGREAYFREALPALAALPGVGSVGGIQLLPVTFGNWSFPMHVDGHPVPEGTPPPPINIRIVSGRYFETMGIPLVAGRLLGPTDGAEGAPVVTVNQAFVERYWPEGEPVGRGLRIFGATGTWREVVGVVGDVRHHGLDRPVLPEVYLPADQYPYGAVAQHLVLRTDVPPESLMPAVREALAQVDGDVPLERVETMEEVVRSSLARTRLILTLLSVFALVALILAAVGVYGVTSFVVTRRRREFGLRRALGATEGGLLGRAVRGAGAAIACGVVVGVLLARLAGRSLAGLLYGVEPGDPATLAAVAALMALVAVAASVVPAFRATRADPAEVLRED